MRAADGAIEGVKIVDGDVRADGDRRRRAGRHVRLRARRRGRGARRRRHARPLRALHPRAVGALRQDRRGERLLPLRRRLPLAARRARAPVREGVDRDRLEHPLPRPRHRARGDRAGAARRLVRLLPQRGERGEDRPRAEAAARAHRRRPGTSPARARRSPRSRSPSARPRTRCSTRSSTSSSPAAPTSTTCSSTSSSSPDDAGRRQLRRARAST